MPLRHRCGYAADLPRSGDGDLGHSGVAITMNAYAHVLPALLDVAVDGTTSNWVEMKIFKERPR